MLFIAIIVFGLPLYVITAIALARRPVWAMWVVLGLYLFEVITVTTDGVNIGIHIYPGDIVFPVLLGAALMRLWLGLARKTDWALVALVMLFSHSLMRGFVTYGMKTAGVESRGVFYLLASALFFSTCRVNLRFVSKFCNAWLHCCVVLLVIAAFRWVAVALGLGMVAQFAEMVGSNPMRVINAGAAFFLATGFLMSFYLESAKKGPIWQRKLLYYIGPAVLLLQHRTVWVLLIVAFLWMSWRDPRFRKWLPIGTASMTAIGLVVVAVVFGARGGVDAYLSNSATNEHTFMWRLGGWIQLLGGFFGSGGEALLLGQPFGTGWARVLGGSQVNVGPHDYYVQVLLRTGFLGLFCLLCVYRRALHKQRACNPYPGWRFWTVAMVAQLIYNVTYGLGYEQGMILGIAVAMAPAESRSVIMRSATATIPKATSQYRPEGEGPAEASCL